jgi:hypothetical protein
MQDFIMVKPVGIRRAKCQASPPPDSDMMLAIVDATIVNAPFSTKNADKARDPEMHRTKKGSLWYFGMKAHFGVDTAPS